MVIFSLELQYTFSKDTILLGKLGDENLLVKECGDELCDSVEHFHYFTWSWE